MKKTEPLCFPSSYTTIQDKIIKQLLNNTQL